MLRVSRSGYYEWLGRAPSARQVTDEQLSTTITEVHQASRGTYGAPRVHAELRLGLGVACGHLWPTAEDRTRKAAEAMFADSCGLGADSATLAGH